MQACRRTLLERVGAHQLIAIVEARGRSVEDLERERPRETADGAAAPASAETPRAGAAGTQRKRGSPRGNAARSRPLPSVHVLIPL
mmetsp:Transcript_19528/g.39569  ORF Transcript_19528/g.39569 Transcript_19528/m.39569 type:complete len:86 (-) Transcript_19528:363-620(-)